MATFDGSLESVVAAVDAVLEENPRTSGKQLREVVAGLESEVLNGEVAEFELVPGEDGSIEWGGVRYVPADQVVVVEPQQPSKFGDGDLPAGLTVDDDGRMLRWQGDGYRRVTPNDFEPIVVSDGAVSQAFAEAADVLDRRPNLSTTNHKVAKWLRSL